MKIGLKIIGNTFFRLLLDFEILELKLFFPKNHHFFGFLIITFFYKLGSKKIDWESCSEFNSTHYVKKLSHKHEAIKSYRPFSIPPLIVKGHNFAHNFFLMKLIFLYTKRCLINWSIDWYANFLFGWVVRKLWSKIYLDFHFWTIIKILTFWIYFWP